MDDMPITPKSEVIEEKWRWKEVPKEPRGYYLLQGRYRFRNYRTGKSASVTGYSKTTRYKRRGEELQILRGQAIDNARRRLCALDPDCPGAWYVDPDLPCVVRGRVLECAVDPDFPCDLVVEEIENEVWLKW